MVVRESNRWVTRVMMAVLALVLAIGMTPGLLTRADADEVITPDDYTEATADPADGSETDTSDRVADDSGADDFQRTPAADEHSATPPAENEDGLGQSQSPSSPAYDATTPDADVLELSIDDPASTATSAAQPMTASSVPSGAYLIVPAYTTNMALDVAGGSPDSGANVQIWTANNTAAQRFQINVADDGWATVVNAISGKVLDVTGASKTPGANVQVYDANGTQAQWWRITANGDGTYTFESALDYNLVLDVTGRSSADGANVTIYSRNDTPAQRFKLYNLNPTVAPGAAIEEGVYSLRSSLGNGMTLDVASASRDDGAPLQIYPANGTLAQQFYIQQARPGFYTLRALHSGKYLAIGGGSIIPGTPAIQWRRCSSDQEWAFTAAADGTWTLTCRINGLALDVASGGTAVQAYTPNGSAAQRWTLEPVDDLLGSGGLYRMVQGFGSGRVLDVAGASTASGARVQTYSWNETAAQRWSVTLHREVGSSVYTFESVCSGLLMTREGAAVVQRPASASSDQYWRAVPSPAGGITLLNVGDPTLALDVGGAVDADGASVGVYRSNGTAAQAFYPETVAAISSGIYWIDFAPTGRALDVSGASVDPGANVQVYDFNDTGAQKWSVDQNADGTYRIVNVRSGMALDVQDAKAAPGANVQQYPSNNTAAQRWSIRYAGGGRFAIISALGEFALTATGNAANSANVAIDAVRLDAPQTVVFHPTTYEVPLSALLGNVGSAPGGWGVQTFGGQRSLSQQHADGLMAATDAIRNSGYRVGYVVIDLKTGRGFANGADEVIYSASTIKGPYVAAICHYLPGSVGPWMGVMESTITVSSNEGYSMLRNAFGSFPMSCLMTDSDVHSFSAASNYVWYSVKDFAKLWLTTGTYLMSDEPYADWCRDIYNHSYYSTINYTLNPRPNTTAYSKPGWYPNYKNYLAFNDGGVVDRDGQRYVVAILSTAYERFDLLNGLVAAIDDAAYDLR